MEPKEFLKQKGIKITKGRVEILNILKNSQNSLSAEKIYQINRDNNININLSTVYRTLELFEEKQITEKITLNDGVFAYKLRGKTHRHYLECDICHKEVEIPCPMSQIEEMVQNTTGFTLTNHDLIMKGICKDCKKKH
ncbi:Fur family transcriptional regulator [Clostridium saccharobutylicum]|uniref:Fe2+/Zn2+ uptake regulation protein n=1 Tax=Clostridium saccharobutylicum DSM 13864 TaxID=1345695 RepID=U5MWK7_CLOSA|nr:Fur family transcriptional regulator [Clostridium saccharobutylicum]AGX44965.1 Fe2+/Zn2+ uptake regulation protein [Clostridium saccharobutylicum DSM 13864]AQR92247.1 peroxide-responsive repressor PerR [Clostridium saccharobutylicum]AQS02149.1 peroxide-responsive repressor PerR [Clostridium saccharobutylicum]AQS11753.1 peroxide-responsive repressor PerR [Clostridium saccharobutylicum]AQS16132.1 peroxide-responsive repressor PerR [Clostridium saccharobutylicum]